MTTAGTFYDRYHQKNQRYFKVIKPGNFTYWYIVNFLHQACTDGFKDKRVLDVGCGVGTISLFLASQGAKVKGVDISPRAIKIARQAQQSTDLKSLKFVEGEVKPEPSQYDLITCFEVVEHVPDEKKFLTTLRTNLKPDGILVLSTPSLENWLYKFGFYRAFDREVGHLRRYTPEILKQRLSEAGFEVIKLRSVEGPLRNLLFTTKLGFLIKGIKGPLVPLFHWFDQVSGWLFGFSDLQVIAKKA